MATRAQSGANVQPASVPGGAEHRYCRRPVAAARAPLHTHSNINHRGRRPRSRADSALTPHGKIPQTQPGRRRGRARARVRRAHGQNNSTNAKTNNIHADGREQRDIRALHRPRMQSRQSPHQERRPDGERRAGLIGEARVLTSTTRRRARTLVGRVPRRARVLGGRHAPPAPLIPHAPLSHTGALSTYSLHSRSASLTRTRSTDACQQTRSDIPLRGKRTVVALPSKQHTPPHHHLPAAHMPRAVGLAST